MKHTASVGSLQVQRRRRHGSRTASDGCPQRFNPELPKEGGGDGFCVRVESGEGGGVGCGETNLIGF
jgi:hypothetical protein